MVKIDSIDRRILEELQRDAARPIEQIASQVGLTQNPCWRRIKRLEAIGVIQRRVAIVDPAKLGLGLTVYVSVRTNQHYESWLERFASGMRKIPEVVELYRMSGETDYLLKAIVPDLRSVQELVNETLLGHATVTRVCTSIVLDALKTSNRLPLAEVP